MPRQAREQVAEYLRMSTDKQCYSTASQREAIRAYFEREGLEVVRSYVDEARSGVTMKRRDGL
jgi:DNA invertase Pin-like site-specific DNA recombinase